MGCKNNKEFTSEVVYISRLAEVYAFLKVNLDGMAIRKWCKLDNWVKVFEQCVCWICSHHRVGACVCVRARTPPKCGGG